MDYHIKRYLDANPRLMTFVRYNPIWYRYLSRSPEMMKELEKEAKVFYGKTIPQQVQNLNSKIQMVNMLAQVAKAMKE